MASSESVADPTEDLRRRLASQDLKLEEQTHGLRQITQELHLLGQVTGTAINDLGEQVHRDYDAGMVQRGSIMENMKIFKKNLMTLLDRSDDDALMKESYTQSEGPAGNEANMENHFRPFYFEDCPLGWTKFRLYFTHLASSQNWSNQRSRRNLIFYMASLDSIATVSHISVTQSEECWTLKHLLDKYSLHFLPPAQMELRTLIWENSRQEGKESLRSWHVRNRLLSLEGHPDCSP